MFVRRLTISVDDWVQLSALATELGHVRSSLLSVMSSRASSGRDPQLVLMAGWLYRRRRRVLKSVCCTTDEHRQDLLDACEQKLARYR